MDTIWCIILHFACCPQRSAYLGNAAAFLAHKDCRAAGKLEVKPEVAAEAAEGLRTCQSQEGETVRQSEPIETNRTTLK